MNFKKNHEHLLNFHLCQFLKFVKHKKSYFFNFPTPSTLLPDVAALLKLPWLCSWFQVAVFWRWVLLLPSGNRIKYEILLCYIPCQPATGWMIWGSNPGGGEIFRTCSDQPWGPPSLLYSGHQVFPGGKEWPGCDADPSPLFSAVVMKG